MSCLSKMFRHITGNTYSIKHAKIEEDTEALVLEHSSKFWSFFLEDADFLEVDLIHKLLNVNTRYSIIGGFYLDPKSQYSLMQLRGFMVFDRLVKRSKVLAKLGPLKGLDVWPAHGSIRDRISDCQAADWFWQQGSIKL